jgi:nitroimidazol reductase NimA-like FMN-containing flavoprotein (pyridoxamine 5'-phosphate oxidase superfamily)
MRAIDLLGGTEVISDDDCWDMLATKSVGRLAVTMDGRIEIFPVNYEIDGEGIVFRTNGGRKMSWATSGEVAFEVDCVDEETHYGWSVVIHGTARDISRSDRASPDSWTGPKAFLVRVDPRNISGRQVTPRSYRV